MRSLLIASLALLAVPAAAGAQSDPLCQLLNNCPPPPPQPSPEPSPAPSPSPSPTPTPDGSTRPVDPQPTPGQPSQLVAIRKRKTKPIVGISDQNPFTFSDPTFGALGLGYARLITPWNSIRTRPAELDRWLRTARAVGIEPLVSFNHSETDKCPARPCKAPSLGAYTKAFKAFRKKYPWVKVISPWNEANHQSQPLAKKPKLAARYYNVVRANCRGCKVVAADVLDSTNLAKWLKTFKRTAKKPRLWGLHNYTDTNRFRATGTAAMVKLVKGEIWLTETGGVVSFTTADGRPALPYNEARAARSIKYMFTLARRYPKRIKRLYIYQWRKNNSFDRFDAGILGFDGKPRPSLAVLQKELSKTR
ncbi:MAG: hypothetical protein H0V29_08590 [Thermoleophilaceae bacterium]|nr:hypothetical protein [Thermoleophilaceae bacterium]